MTPRPAPLVSIIIPTYNRAGLVGRAVDSALRQTFTDYEIIVVDDASTDDTRGYLHNRYQDTITYIQKKENQGLSAARNSGIAAAQGTYLAFLDDDDEWFSDKLSLQIELIRHAPAVGLVYCGAVLADDNNNFLRALTPSKKGSIFEDILCWNCITGSASAALIRKDILKQTGFFDVSLSACEDWDLWIRISQCSEVAFIDQCLVTCTVHAHNMHKDISRMEKNTFLVLEKYQAGIDTARRIEIARSQSVFFAWQYYQAGQTEEFNRMIFKALRYNSCDPIPLPEGDVSEEEHAFFTACNLYWSSPEAPLFPSAKKKSYAQHYLNFAWHYYNNNDMHNFRKCLMRFFKYSFPRIPLRLVLSLCKSFLGKNLSDIVHTARKKLWT